MSEKKEKIEMMVSGAFLILFTGFPHIWSIYQPYVIRETGWSLETVSICFYLPTLFFVFGNMVGGRVADQKGPRVSLGIGGFLFAAGMILAGRFLGIHPMLTYLTLGIMQGIGQGMVYAVILSTAQKWFQDRTGFATGVVITANGLCGFILSPISKRLLEFKGSAWSLCVTGAVIAIAAGASLVYVRQPGQFQTMDAEDKVYGEKKQYTSSEMIRTKSFYFLAGMMLCGLMPYYLLSPVSQTLQAQRGVLETVALASVMAGSILNAGMRLFLPTLSDRIGKMACVQGVILASVTAMGFALTGNGMLTTAAVILSYGCFGGIMGNFPSLTSSIFGLKHAAENYGVVMSGIIIVTIVSPVISGMIEKMGMNVNVRFLVGGFFAICAWIFCVKLKMEILQRN